jgi:hypothetical protein
MQKQLKPYLLMVLLFMTGLEKIDLSSEMLHLMLGRNGKRNLLKLLHL